MSRPFSPRNSPSSASYARVNGKIRSREVRVVDTDKKQLGIMQLSDALNMARSKAVDLVEIAPNADPPVCRLIDFGKYRYEIAKQEKEARKHQHANKVKEIQLSPNIDPHDFSVKLQHAITFFCEDMKVKISLRFRGREMAHKEFGFQTVNKLVKELLPFAHPDHEPKLVGKGINVMLTPLPRNKRAKNPNESERASLLAAAEADVEKNITEDDDSEHHSSQKNDKPDPKSAKTNQFGNTPFEGLDLGLK